MFGPMFGPKSGSGRPRTTPSSTSAFGPARVADGIAGASSTSSREPPRDTPNATPTARPARKPQRLLLGEPKVSTPALLPKAHATTESPVRAAPRAASALCAFKGAGAARNLPPEVALQPLGGA